jgi:hypothetical protein
MQATIVQCSLYAVFEIMDVGDPLCPDYFPYNVFYCSVHVHMLLFSSWEYGVRKGREFQKLFFV